MADHNEEFIADPTGHLIAILDETREADQAERDLSEAGFSEVHVYRGADGVETIDSSGSEHGATGGLVRLLQQAYTNKDNLAEYEEAVRRGHIVIAVKVDDDDLRDRADDILESHGAHTVNHFSKAVVRTIKP